MDNKPNFRQGKVTPGIFEAIKILFSNGSSANEISKFMKMSTDTVYFIRDAETYDDYKAIMYEKSQKYRNKVKAIKAKEAKEVAEKVGAVPAVQLAQPQVVEHRQTVQITATHYMMEEMKKTNELLTIISRKLAAIVSDLYGVKDNAQQDN